MQLDPESVDLAVVAEVLRTSVGGSVAGPIVGRTRLRDEVARYLACSQLDAELIVDTMVTRGFLVLRDDEQLGECWTIPVR